MSWLIEKLSAFDNKDALVINDITYNYRELVNEVRIWSELITLSQIPRGAIIYVESDNSHSLVALILSLYTNKNIIVPIHSKSHETSLKYHQLAQVEYSINLNNDKGFLKTEYQGDHKFYCQLRKDNAAGLVLLSSGTSGKPKGIVLNFDKIIDRLRDLQQSRRIICFLNFDHVGGINTLLYTLSSGGCVIFPLNRSIDTVLSCIERWKVEVLPTTPTFINIMLMANLFDKYSLTSLSLITYGTEAMPTTVLTKIAERLPAITFKQTYGLSELGILATKSKSNKDNWLKIGGNGFDYKIIDQVLWIKSDTAMLGYLNAPSPFDKNGYFNTQDLVETDGDYIRILGRESEIINVAGEKVYPLEIEEVLSQVPGVLDIAVTPEKNPITGMAIKAIVKYSLDVEPSQLEYRIARHAKENLAAYKRPMLYSFTVDDLHSSRFKKKRKF